MSYWTYYFGWMLLAYAMRQPWLLVGVVVFLVLRRFIPDPRALFRALARMSALKSQVELNAANIPARRDLAEMYLDLRRPRTALKLIEQALVRTPDDAELLYLRGFALDRTGRHEDALAPLVRAVELDPRVRFGQPYLVAGDALFALGRIDAAVDAYERYADTNGSDVVAHTSLARALARHGDRDAAVKAIDEAVRTWRVLPGRFRRRRLAGYFSAQWARVWLLRQPAAIGVALAIVATMAFSALAAYPRLVNLAEERRAQKARAAAVAEADRRLVEAYGRCGTQSTGDFQGRYVAIPDDADLLPVTVSSAEREAWARVAKLQEDQFEGFEIAADRIRSGATLVQEFCLTRTLRRSPSSLDAEAVWHEDIADIGDASLVTVHLRRDGDLVHMSISDSSDPREAPIATLRRK